MADVSINKSARISEVKLQNVNFTASSKDNKPSSDEKMKTSTKMMIGASALAVAVLGGLAVAKGLKKGKIPKDMGEFKPTDLSGASHDIKPNETREVVQEFTEVVQPSADAKSGINDVKQEIAHELKPNKSTELVQEQEIINNSPSVEDKHVEIPIKQEKAPIEETVNEVKPEKIEEKTETVVADGIKEVKTDYIEDNKYIAPYLKDGKPVEDSLTEYIMDKEKGTLDYMSEENSYLKRLLNEGNEIKYVVNDETGALEIKCGEYSFPSREFVRLPDGKIEITYFGGNDIEHVLDAGLSELAENQIREGEYIAEELNCLKDDKEGLLNRIHEYVKTVGGFKECNKTINSTDSYGNRVSYNVIYEGVSLLITEDGQLLIKELEFDGERRCVNILDRIREHAAECAREYVCSVY